MDQGSVYVPWAFKKSVISPLVVIATPLTVAPVMAPLTLKFPLIDTLPSSSILAALIVTVAPATVTVLPAVLLMTREPPAFRCMLVFVAG